jgi:hypothetical protein
MNPLADYIKKFDADRVSMNDANKIAEACAEIVKTYCKGKNFLLNEDEVIEFIPMVGGNPKQILIQPANTSSAKLLSYYAQLMREQIIT